MQHYFQPYGVFANLNALKLRLGDHLLKFALRVSPFEEHESKRQLDDDAVHRVEMHVIGSLVEVLFRRISPQVDDERLPAWLENAIHLL